MTAPLSPRRHAAVGNTLIRTAATASSKTCPSSSHRGKQSTRLCVLCFRMTATILVRSFSVPTQTGNRVSASLADGRIVESDLFIAADGSNSEIRRRLLPDVLPNYAGYVAWRGTLEEAEAGPDLKSFFDDTFTFSEARSGGHILVYFIPGANADVRPGHRRLNWVWYVQATDADLARMLVDKSGKARRTSLPQGFAHPSVVSELHARSERSIRCLPSLSRSLRSRSCRPLSISSYQRRCS